MSRVATLSVGVLPRLLLVPGTRGGPLWCRWATTSAPGAPANKDRKKAFSATLHLPKTNLPLRLKDVPKHEAKFRDRTTHELYRKQYEDNEGPIFILHDGPPYANGNLHMGHALNKILKDMITRYNVMRGRKVHYIPGWDCHGLPIEHKALAALGKSHTSLDSVSVRQEARKFALQAIDTQKAEMKVLGVMADWDNPDGVYRTLDHPFEIRQLKLFQDMVGKGFVTHRLRPTYYSPTSRTALAEAELEYTDMRSTSVYVSMSVSQEDMTPRLREAFDKGTKRNPNAQLHIAIWTTTPWTLPANMGIAVHNSINYAVALDAGDNLLIVAEERLEALKVKLGPLDVVDTLTGAELVGTRYNHLFHPPGAGGTRPTVFAADYVTADSGTGLVHSAPAHGHDDYDGFMANGLPLEDLRCPVDDGGCFTEELLQWSGDETVTPMVGRYAMGPGSKQIIEYAKAKGVLLAQETYEHRYPIDWRTKKPIMIRATPQWFADVETLKPDAVAAIEKINFVPPHGRNRLSATVLSRSEWCISRQRSWGVPIPALFDINGEPLLTVESLEHIISVLQDKGLDYWWSAPAEEFVPPSRKGEHFTKGIDTLDVWFDSGTSWSLIADAHLRSPSEPLADVYLEGSDQHRGWFQSSILTRLAALQGSGLAPAAPYRHLITHGFTTDEKGQKMSKSLGNGISPMDVINGSKHMPAHGSDVLRMWVAGVDYTRDASIGPTSISTAAELLRKMRSSLRFMVGNTAGEKPLPANEVDLTIIERYVLHELSVLQSNVRDAYDEFGFSRALQALTTYTASLSAFYFDVAKDTLYCDPAASPRRQAIVATLHHIMRQMTKMVAPIVPHLAEEVYEAAGGLHSSVFLEEWEPEMEWQDPEASKVMTALLGLRTAVNSVMQQAREDKHLRTPSEATVFISGHECVEALKPFYHLLPSIFGVSHVSFQKPETCVWSYNTTSATSLGEATLTLSPATRHQCPRCWLYTADEVDALCTRCDNAINSRAQ